MAETRDVQERASGVETTAANEARRSVQPRSAVWSEAGKVIVRLEMPGVAKAGLSIDVDNDKLRVYGKRDPAVPDGKYIIRERRDADFLKVYTLDETIDRESIDAVLENGIVTITLHMTESARPRKIEVRRG